MTSITQFYRLNILTNVKSVIIPRNNINVPLVCSYSRKSAEEKLGIEKPKRPLTTFFKFMTQMRPALLAKNPGVTAKEAIAWSSKHWQELDAETKIKMQKEYQKDIEDYKKIKALYDASLTEDQKTEIKKVKDEMAQAKEKRKLKSDYKTLGRPKKPMSSYMMFMCTRRHLYNNKDLGAMQKEIKKEWTNLPQKEKDNYNKQAHELLAKYQKELQAWELKMISIGRSDLVRARPTRAQKTKEDKNKQ